MKFKISFFLLALLLTNLNAQQDGASSMHAETSVNALHITVDSVEELQDIDWAEIRELFRENKPDSTIELGFSLREKVNRKKYTMNSFEFAIRGKSDEVASMISKTQKIIDSLTDTE